MNQRFLFLTIILVPFLLSCERSTELSGEYIKVEYDDKMHSIVSTSYTGDKMLMSAASPSEYLIIEGREVKDFNLISSEKTAFEDPIGQGLKLLLVGENTEHQSGIKKLLEVKLYDDFPRMIFTRVSYVNSGKDTLKVSGWVNNAYTLEADPSLSPGFWSYQSGSYASRPDWVLPLEVGFSQRNYMGMNASDYGGGTPVCDVWRKDAGLAVGHVEASPKLVSIPVSYPQEMNGAQLSVVYEKEQRLDPGDSLETLNTFVAVHQGDYFQSLEDYSAFMSRIGVSFQPFPESTYEPIWCAWGYERDFNVKEVLETLPKVKELGFKWAVLDDGWQVAEGDWSLNPGKFPRGEAGMKDFVQKIHDQGLKAKLWWAPLAADPGTELHEQHSDMLLINKDGEAQDISWWDSHYLCPAYEKTIDYTRDLVKKMIDEWDYDGLKIDGQHLNGVPPCYNPAHEHSYPEVAVEKLPDFFKMIYETALAIKPDAVVEICPCGTAYAFHTMPYMNQPVSSDPMSSWQIRLKGKTLKALMGRDAPYYGDHVELSDNGSDFASTVGIGAVVGTKFTWPDDRHEHDNYVLTPEKEKDWKKWVDIYQQEMLSKGQYLGELYDIGYDRPETHVIRKSDTLYYAFYAEQFNGTIDLRGLENTVASYEVIDYVRGEKLGTVTADSPVFTTSFEDYLLIKCLPAE